MKFSAVFVILLVLLTVAVLSENAGRTYCGRYLARTLANLCSDAGQEKRGEDWSWLSASGRKDGAVTENGVANECCLHPCTLEVLLSYC
ncbi:bombyxin E-1-like [Bombyx mandarina]|uniref:IGF-like peptide n=2 Tax=Bombyx TaxID=7090 RepID=B9A0V1_BOMMO|nr:IGF-like peptide precursor [Bombyx mori]XP_028042884.1 bombyxin E-1-like [Bombyx mandarina]BAH16557.1 IGF-like peptide [Bombyx mori]BAH16558.1 IGF-like peptide [Bombyx mori]BAH16559.1 IGF-like peptide [Bombyx mori]BAH16560.1 IGF-like peptide [Bombyx mori]BAH16561.1 IGF-like peptide [Bombyx mori]